jgi:hypothetical protein
MWIYGNNGLSMQLGVYIMSRTCFTDSRQFYVVLWLCHQELQRKGFRVCLSQALGPAKASIF